MLAAFFKTRPDVASILQVVRSHSFINVEVELLNQIGFRGTIDKSLSTKWWRFSRSNMLLMWLLRKKKHAEGIFKSKSNLRSHSLLIEFAFYGRFKKTFFPNNVQNISGCSLIQYFGCSTKYFVLLKYNTFSTLIAVFTISITMLVLVHLPLTTIETLTLTFFYSSFNSNYSAYWLFLLFQLKHFKLLGRFQDCRRGKR